MTTEQILKRIEELTSRLTDSSMVTQEEMDRLYPVYGSEQAIKNYKSKCNDEINAEIDKLNGLLVSP